MIRTPSRRSTLAVTLVLCSSLLVFSCGEKENPVPDPSTEDESATAIGGSLVYRYSFPVRTLNAIKPLDRHERKVSRFHLNLALLEKDPDSLEFRPWLAAKLPEAAADGLSQTWTLRPEARWSDGSEVTSADVVATWNLLNARELPAIPLAAVKDAIGPVSTVKALDERRFQVVMRETDALAAFRFGLNFPIIPKAAIPEQVGEIWKLDVLPGTGPYRLKELGPDLCELERIEPWWGDELEPFAGLWRIKNFRYKYVPETVAAVEQMKKGLLDFMPGDVAEYKSLMAKADEYQLDGTNYYLNQFSMIGFNCRRAPFSDARVRRALALAVPREKINELHIGGLGRAVSGPFANGSPYVDPEVEVYDYRPLKAKELLAEAGFEDSDGDGVLDRKGVPFRFTLTRQINGRIWSDGIVNLLRESLAQIGVVMEVEDLAQDAAFHRYWQKQHDAYIEVWEVDDLLPQFDLYTILHSSQIPEPGYNWQVYSNPVLDALLVEFATTTDAVRRVEVGRTIHRHLHDEQPILFLFNNPSCVVWNRRIGGVVTHPLGVLPWDFKIAN